VRDGFIQLSGPSQRRPQIVLTIGKFGLQPDALAQMLQRFFGAPLLR